MVLSHGILMHWGWNVAVELCDSSYGMSELMLWAGTGGTGFEVCDQGCLATIR